MRLLGLSLPWLSVAFYAASQWSLKTQAPETMIVVRGDTLGSARLGLSIFNNTHDSVFLKQTDFTCFDTSVDPREIKGINTPDAGQLYFILRLSEGSTIVTPGKQESYVLMINESDHKIINPFIESHPSYKCWVGTLFGFQSEWFSRDVPLINISVEELGR